MYTCKKKSQRVKRPYLTLEKKVSKIVSKGEQKNLPS